VNKADRPEADRFVKNLQLMLAPAFRKHYHEVPIIKTVASTGENVGSLVEQLKNQLQKSHLTDKYFWLLAERAFYLIERKRMQDVDKSALKSEIEKIYQKGTFNLYSFIENK
jgi:LAO/AO transport system kinase